MVPYPHSTRTQSSVRRAARRGQRRPPKRGGGGGVAAHLPFAPDKLDRVLEKVDKGLVRQPIDNSIDGLRNYLSAVNIRNKCKHPLFLALRFDACIGLLYDSSRAANPADLAADEPFERMMAVLTATEDRPLRLEAYQEAALKAQLEPEQVSVTAVRHEHDAADGIPPPARLINDLVATYLPEYVIAVKSHHGSGPCGLADCPVRLSAALSLPHCDALPSTYTLMSAQELGVLRRTYCRLHCASECAAKAVGAPAPAAPPPAPPPPTAGLGGGDSCTRLYQPRQAAASG
mmetsp:Transcript_10861/g.35651  ORF Transcript_10861/g.35651 Transcript_10861/m.35651 type:complete len:289 (-) Transcript_10861:353-1219(-)